MRFRIFLFLLLSLWSVRSGAQMAPTQIRYTAWDIHALRFYPFKEKADSIVNKAIQAEELSLRPETNASFCRTSVAYITDKDFFKNQIHYAQNANDWLIKRLLKPYSAWEQYAHPFQKSSQLLNLVLLDESIQGNKVMSSSTHTLFERLGADNINYFLKESLGKADLHTARNDVFLYTIKTPLNRDYFDDFHFFLSAHEVIDSIPCYEVVFFSKKKKDNAYEGYLYISHSDYSLVKAVFTLNNSLNKKLIEEILFTQTQDKIETQAFSGNEEIGSLALSQTRSFRANEHPDNQSAEWTTAQSDFSQLQEEANKTRAYRNTQNGIYFLLTGHIPGKYFNPGPILQTISYNQMEGLRLRAGGNTAERFSRKIQLGGYAAYGLKDEKWKYRGDVDYFFTSNDRLSFSYVNDLNIPGYDLLKSKRDHIFRSFTHSGTDNMSLQHVGSLIYEKDFPGLFSLRLGGKYLSDKPQGKVRYFRTSEDTQEIIPKLNTSEIHFGLRYAPNERYVRIGNRKINFREPDMEMEINHRIGIKNLFHSDFSYHITDFSIHKKTLLPVDIGSLSLRLSGGKVWNKVPFPLLFIPAGNQSYIYDSKNYNLMKFYEFITDQHLAGNLNMEFNWSPFELFMNSAVKTNLGIRSIYGSLSNQNDPSLQPDLFVFNNGVRGLGNRPYTEVNIGLVNLLKVFRVDYIYRLNYGKKGSLFLTSSFLF